MAKPSVTHCLSLLFTSVVGVTGGSAIKKPSANRGFSPWVMKFPWRRKWQPSPVFLPGKSHGQRSLAKELDTTEVLNNNNGNVIIIFCCVPDMRKRQGALGWGIML